MTVIKPELQLTIPDYGKEPALSLVLPLDQQLLAVLWLWDQGQIEARYAWNQISPADQKLTRADEHPTAFYRMTILRQLVQDELANASDRRRLVEWLTSRAEE